jgi:exosortase
MSTAAVGTNKKSSSHFVSWPILGWVTALVLICYFPVIVRLVRQWANDDDMGHGFFVPVLAAWIAWQKLEQVRFVPPTPDWRGLILVGWSAFQLYVATIGAELFLARTALIVTIIGVVWLLCGLRYLKILAFPLFLLFFMVPIPGVVYTSLTFPLQLFASRVAELSLTVLGIPVILQGNVLELTDMKLNVVEACSGIRSLLSLTFLSLVYGYFFEKNDWIRVLLFLSSIPIAIAANAGRVTLTGVLASFSPALAEGLVHEAEGWVIFMIALCILAVIHQILTRGWSLVERWRS